MAGLWNNVIQYVPSRPSRARELKRDHASKHKVVQLSRPSRARELKHVRELYCQGNADVAPLAGA